MIYPVSIPIGFSHQLRRRSTHQVSSQITRFNPYRVFSSAETSGNLEYDTHNFFVSIPIGFSHQLRPISRPAQDDEGEVSIPIGFSHQLRPWSSVMPSSRYRGFNPYRVFSSAETGRGPGARSRVPSFNPYRVFSSAETGARAPPRRPRQSFNPYRVFSSAETELTVTGKVRRYVSIPIGFSHQLRRTRRKTASRTMFSFNPYRVFSSAETGYPALALHAPLGFNPYRVFSSAETYPASADRQLDLCFNPYRVFSSAETRICWLRLRNKNKFQSLSGFLIS